MLHHSKIILNYKLRSVRYFEGFGEYIVVLRCMRGRIRTREYNKHGKMIKGQMHHHNHLGSKCAYTCHLSNKTTRKSVLLSTPQIWLMKVSKKTSLSLGMEADIAGQLSPIKHNQWYEVTASAASDWLRDISDCH